MQRSPPLNVRSNAGCSDYNPMHLTFSTAVVVKTQPTIFYRHSFREGEKQQEKFAEEYVNFITQNYVLKAMTVQEIACETKADTTLQRLQVAIRLNMWEADCLKPYRPIKDELTVGALGVILRGTRIIIPSSLQQRAVDIAHENHQGLSKTKALLREKIWFPGIDELAQQTLQSCLACQAVGNQPPPEPLHLQEMPKGPWEKIHIDFFGPLLSGDYLLAVIDRYSRFPEVEIVQSTKASVVISKLDKIFSVHGLPDTVKTDK